METMNFTRSENRKNSRVELTLLKFVTRSVMRGMTSKVEVNYFRFAKQVSSTLFKRLKDQVYKQTNNITSLAMLFDRRGLVSAASEAATE